MTNIIRSKAELLAIFDDLNPLVITKQNMRDFIVSNLVFASQKESAPAAMLAQSDVFVAEPGCNAITLPPIADYGDRSAFLVNTSGAQLTVTPDGAETIDGLASVVIDDEHFALISSPQATNWVTLINTTPDTAAATFLFLTDTPPSFAGQADQILAVNATEDAVEFIAPPSTTDQYALASIAASGATTNIINNTYVDINDSMVDIASSAELAVGVSEVTYVGIATKLFAIDASLFIQANGDQYTSAIVVNGTPVAEMQQDLSNAKSGSCSLFGIVSLSTNDTIKVQVRGDSTSNDVVIPDMHLRLTEIPS